MSSPGACLRCRACGAGYALDEGAWRCRCGGLFDLGLQPPDDAFAGLGTQPWSLWRYRKALPFSASATGWQAITMGEGATPLVAIDGGLRLKLDFLMPTLSFKDRGSVVLVAKAAEIGVHRLVADSSGNAGASIAAYAARAGIDVEVFVPATTSEKKLAQLEGYGATVHCVSGSRADTAAAAIDHVAATGAFYASHVYNPLFHHGTKTFAFELWEQLGGRLPSTVLLPAGNGTLLIGASIGFKELAAAGLVGHVPRLVAVQAERCAPLAHAARAAHQGEALRTTAHEPGPAPAPGATAAEGIAIAEPARLAQMLDVVAESGGTVLTATEQGIASARLALAAKGIDVEPTAATVYAAWLEWPGAPAPSSTVLAITGAGLKSPPPSHRAATAPQPEEGHEA
ncbi:MAG: pyridoxal-phosphate dependent enzyme [Acidimicrobiales bacterium]